MPFPETDPALDVGPVERFFEARTGIVLARAGVRARASIERAMRDAGCDAPDAYVARLVAEPGLFDALASALTVCESYFFRDAWQFDAVRDRVLPAVAARRRAGGPGLRAWSAGCATGEEIYSLAAVLAGADALGGALLLGTDLDVEALAKARVGRYRDWSLRGEGAERMGSLLTRVGTLWEVDRRLRGAVTFRAMNLARDPFPSMPSGVHDFDVILCRNVLLYFDEATIHRVTEALARSLSPGGLILTGPSDPPIEAPGLLVPEVLDHGRRAHRRADPSPRELPAAPAAPPRDAGPPRLGRPPSDGLEAALERLRRLARIDPPLALAEATDRAAASPDHAELRLLEASLLVSQDRAADARRVLEGLVTRRPDCAVAHFMLGSLRLRAGDAEGARRALERACQEAERVPADAPLPGGDGQPAGQLVEAARRRLRGLAEDA